jgi:dihydroflavonol-4-reductase
LEVLVLTVVTGASGFVGGLLTRALLSEGRRVRAVDLVRGPALDGLDVEWMEADVLDPTRLEEVMAGAKVVYHLAAVISVTGDPTGTVWATNVEGVQNTAEAALTAGVERFVHCSSIHAYDIGYIDGVVTEDSARSDHPDLPVYDRSKAAGERALHSVIDKGLDAVICNPTAVVGPGDFTNSRMNTVLVALFEGRLPALVAGGFDWVDVRDVTNSLINAEHEGRTGENYLLPGHHMSVRELGTTVEDVTGVPKPRVTVPMWFARTWSPLANVVSRRTGNPLWYTSESLNALRSDPRVSGVKAREELGHAPRPLKETIEDLYRWSHAGNREAAIKRS